MKIQYDEGPEAIGTDEGAIPRGVPTEVSDVLGEKLLTNENYKFRRVDEPSRKKKEERKW